MTDLDTRKPEFSLALRGYDRDQVDGYVQRLQLLLQEAELRAREAESAAPHPAGKVRALHLVPDPTDEAPARDEDTVQPPDAETAAQAANVLEQARKRAQAMIDEATRTAEETRRRSAQEERRLIAQLQHERELLRQELAQLEQRLADERHPAASHTGDQPRTGDQPHPDD